MKQIFVISYLLVAKSALTFSYLYPYETETREVKSLNGLWYFKIPPGNDMNAGLREQWSKLDFSKMEDAIKMPVPSSYNDITTDATIRDHVGWVWYQKTIILPQSWLEDQARVVLHFGSVHYSAMIFVDGSLVSEHEGGHLPFDVEVPRTVFSRVPVSEYGSRHTLTVAVNNTLTPWTLPQGRLYYPNDTSRYPEGYKLYSHSCDYFDYAGINRPVLIYKTNKIYIKDIHITTDIDNDTGIVKFSVKKSDPASTCDVLLHDPDAGVVASAEAVDGCRGELRVPEPRLWWPAGTCHSPAGHLYTLEVRLLDTPDHYVDLYLLPVGIRTIRWTNTSLLVNNEPVYLRGFGMHEDSDIRGRGFDYAVMTRDMHLIGWLGANAFRTSHYPYAVETIAEADARGLMVILEAPACSLEGFDSKLYRRHKDYIQEMIEVYKNHPSIVMWSLANEPVSNSVKAGYYFGNLTAAVREMDSTRPITVVGSQLIENETAAIHTDVVCVNRYRGWYSDSGHTDLISYQVLREVAAWHSKYNKPVVVTEYGAGAVPGLHTLPESMWTEDYQVVTHQQHFLAFDSLRAEGKLAGELMWNFIDFNTPQEYIRPGRCSKGLFTRERQPKSAAHTVRQRYEALGKCPS